MKNAAAAARGAALVSCVPAWDLMQSMRPQQSVPSAGRAPRSRLGASGCNTLGSNASRRQHSKPSAVRKRARGRPANVGAARIALRRPQLARRGRARRNRRGGGVGTKNLRPANRRARHALGFAQRRLRTTPPSPDTAFVLRARARRCPSSVRSRSRRPAEIAQAKSCLGGCWGRAGQARSFLTGPRVEPTSLLTPG